MNIFFSIFLSVFITYMFAVLAHQLICKQTLNEAIQSVNQLLIESFFQKDTSPNINIFFSEAEWRTLETVLSKHFNKLVLYSFCDNHDGTISVYFQAGGILHKFQNHLDILKQCITIDTYSWMHIMIGGEVLMHIQNISDSELHLMFAYNSSGHKKLVRIYESLQKEALPKPKPRKPQTTFTARNPNSSVLFLGIDYNHWIQYQSKLPVTIDLKTHCHILLTGSTGSGKSYALKFYIKQLLYKKNTYCLWFADFKGSSDFYFLQKEENVRYAHGDTIFDLVLEYYALFNNVRNGTQSISCNQTLILDEYPAFVTNLLLEDKKKADKIKSIIADILMLGRDISGKQFNIMITAQRPDTSLLFPHGSRDNFHTWIALGQLSGEAKGMITDSPNELPQNIYQQGEGIVKTNGLPITELIIPEITAFHCAAFAQSPTPTPHP